MDNYRYRLYTTYDGASTQRIEELVAFLRSELTTAPNEEKLKREIRSVLNAPRGEKGKVLALFYRNKLIGLAMTEKRLKGGACSYLHLKYLVLKKGFKHAGLDKKLLKHVLSTNSDEVWVNLKKEYPHRELLIRLGFIKKGTQMVYRPQKLVPQPS